MVEACCPQSGTLSVVALKLFVGMAKHITGVTDTNEGHRLQPTILHFFLLSPCDTGMAHLAICDRLHFHFDDG